MTRLRRLGVLWVLYFVQGLPFGFQATALPVHLRAQGASLTTVGLAGAVALPWLLKPLWAPWVDRYHLPALGRRRTWLLPLQALLACACAAAAWVGNAGLATLLALVAAMNVFAATLDIAVDGLAIDMLRREDLGYANTAQVVGYKLGALTGGGLLLWLVEDPRRTFATMTLLVLAALAVSVAFDEHRATRAVTRARDPAANDTPDQSAPASTREIVARVARALRAPGSGWLLVFIATYKLGESMADVMFKPFLLDAGFTKSQIGAWVGSWGMGFSIVGSLLGGTLASRLSLLPAVGITATLRAVPIAAQWGLTLSTPSAGAVVAVTCAEHLCGGALTTAMFAFMMSRVDRRVGATHFTALAAVEVLGKAPAGWLSGALADSAGYPPVFGIATLLSIAYLGLLWPMRKLEAC